VQSRSVSPVRQGDVDRVRRPRRAGPRGVPPGAALHLPLTRRYSGATQRFLVVVALYSPSVA
jgi:hypothetical protein